VICGGRPDLWSVVRCWLQLRERVGELCTAAPSAEVCVM